MLNYISAKQAALKWGISQRRVALLCAQNRIEGVIFNKNRWLIPENAKKPSDLRTKLAQQENNAKPFLKWAGGKSQLLANVHEQINSYEDFKLKKYVEPMVGSGAVLFEILATHNLESVYISDVNKGLINTYKVIRDDIDVLIESLSNVQTIYYSLSQEQRKGKYYEIRDEYNATPIKNSNRVQKATEFIFLNKTCFNGLYRENKKGDFNVPMGEYKSPKILDEANLRLVSKALQGVTIKYADFSASLDYIDENTLVYLDPPYRPISKTANFNSYTSNSFDDDEQIRLAKFIKNIDKKGAKFILSNSDPQNTDESDDFFHKLYGDYTIRKIEAKRCINSIAKKRGKISELLICN